MRERSWATIVVLSAALTASCHRSPHVANQEYLKSGDGYAAQKKFPEAIIEYRKVVQADPKFGEGRLKLADSYIQVGDVVNAYREYIRAADLLPSDLDAQMKAGNVLLAVGKYDDASARADKALAANPSSVDARILKANALAGLHQLDDAISEIEDAIKNDPNRSASYTSLGAMQLVAGESAGGRRGIQEGRRDRLQVGQGPARARQLLLDDQPADRRRNAAQGGHRPRSEEPARQPRPRLFLPGSAGQPEKAEPYLKAVAEFSPTSDGKLGAGRLLFPRAPDGARSASHSRGTREERQGRWTGSSASKLRLAGLGRGEAGRRAAAAGALHRSGPGQAAEERGRARGESRAVGRRRASSTRRSR